MRCGLVAVAGRPNVGKSTLVNALAGEKVAITSTVPNTTRRRIFGVVNGDDWQLVLVDLPGFQRPMDPLTERMQKTVDTSFEDVDAVLLGGIYAPLAPWLCAQVEEEVGRRVLRARLEPVAVRVSATGPEAAVLGAAASVLQEVLAAPAGLVRAAVREAAGPV